MLVFKASTGHQCKPTLTLLTAEAAADLIRSGQYSGVWQHSHRSSCHTAVYVSLHIDSLCNKNASLF